MIQNQTSSVRSRIDHPNLSKIQVKATNFQEFIINIHLFQDLHAVAEVYSAQYIDTVISTNVHSITRSLVLRKSGKATLSSLPAKCRKSKEKHSAEPKERKKQKTRRKNRSVNFPPNVSSPNTATWKKITFERMIPFVDSRPFRPPTAKNRPNFHN